MLSSSVSISTNESGNFLMISPNNFEFITILPSWITSAGTWDSIPISKSYPFKIIPSCYVTIKTPFSRSKVVFELIAFCTIPILLANSFWLQIIFNVDNLLVAF